jgi:N-acetyl sugar amidotransferase
MKFGQGIQRGKSVIECSRCIFDDTFPSIEFDENGECNYCYSHDELDEMYPIGFEGMKRLMILFKEIKESGKNNPFDCVVGLSGGKDSSYLLHIVVKMGLRPIAVHYDNGWDTQLAKRNIRRIIEILEVPLVNYRVKQNEVDDIIRSFLLSHTQDAEAATDLGLVKCLFQIADTYGVKYILDGHSFRTEGMAPIEWSYMDGRYIKSVHAKRGIIPLKTYPLLTITDQIWYGLKGIKRPRPLYYIDYISKYVQNFLEDTYGWEWYGGHHLENTYTAFFDYYYRYNKLGYDGRLVELSALIRSKQITKKEAKHEMQKPILPKEYEESLLSEIKSRLRFNDDTFDFIMRKDLYKNNQNWPTYREYFRLLKPLFWMMAKTKRIPDSFYLKYCKGV